MRWAVWDTSGSSGLRSGRGGREVRFRGTAPKLEEAHAAADVALTSESCAPMFAPIDEESTLMVHGKLAIAPVSAAATPAGT
jgi:hypothetical protein